MAGSVSSLYVEFSASTKKFSDAMGEVTRSIKEVDKVIKPIRDRMADLGKTMTASLTVPIVGLGVAAFSSAQKIDEAMDSIRAQTGATGVAFEKLGIDFRAVLSEVPNSIDDVSKAIGTLSSRTGLTGKPLQTMATQLLNISRLTKTDVNETIAASTRVFGDWQIATENQSDALDFLFKVGQQTGIGFANLSRSVQQFGVPLREMGFSFEQSAVLLGKFEKEGVNADVVMAALRKSLATLGKAGVTDASAALGVLVDRIQKAGTASQANGIAMAAFGAKAGPTLAAAIREGHFAIDDLLKSIKNSPETVNKAAAATLSFGEKLDILKNKAALALEPIGVKLMDALERLIPTAQRALGAVSDLATGFSKLGPGTQDAIIGTAAFVAVIGPAITIITKISSVVIGASAVILKFGKYFAAAIGPISGFGTVMAAVYVAVAAVGAIIGFAIGSTVNWLLKITGLRDGFDKLLASVLNWNNSVIGTWLTGQNEVNKATEAGAEASKKLVAELTKRNIAFDKTRLGDSVYVGTLLKQIQAQTDAAASAKAHADAITKVGGAAKISANDLAALNKLTASEDAKKAAEAIQQIVDAVVKENNETGNLVTAIGRLEGMHVSATAIREKLGRQIIDNVLGLQMEGKAVPEVLQKYADLRKQHDLYLNTLENFRRDVGAALAPMAQMTIKLAILNGQFDRATIVQTYATEIVALGDKQLDAGGSMDIFTQSFYDQAKAFLISQEGLSEYRKMLEGFEAQLRQMSRTPGEVAAAFLQMKNEGASAAQIIAVMGGSINQAVDIMRNIPGAVDPGTASILAQADAMRKSVEAAIELQNAVRSAEDSLDKLKRTPVEVAAAFLKMQSAGDSPAEIMAVLGSSIASVNQDLRNMPGLTDAATAAILRQAEAERRAIEAQEKWKQGTVDAAYAIVDLRKNAELVAQRVKDLSAAGATNAEIIAVMGGEIQGATDDVRKFKLPIDDATRAILRQMGVVSDAITETEKLRQVWKSALENVEAGFGDAVAKLIFEGKKFSTSMKDIFKDLGETIVKTLVTDAFGKIAKGISGLLLGNKDKGTSGLLGGLLGSAGGALGKLLGIGGKAAGAAGGAAAAGGTAAGGSALGAIGALATNPITIAAAGAAAVGLLVNHFVGQGRKAADKLGEMNAQNFDLSKLMDPYFAKHAAGTLTTVDVDNQRKALQQFVDGQEAMYAQFAAQGKNQAKVVAQSEAGITKMFGEHYSGFFQGLDADLAEVQAKLGTSVASGNTAATAGIPQTGRAVSASTIFADAVDVWKGITDKIADAVAGNAANAQQPPIEINITSAPVITFDGSTLDLATFREQVMPLLLDDLSKNARGAAETLARILGNIASGVTSTGGLAT